MSYLIANPEDRFCHVATQLVSLIGAYYYSRTSTMWNEHDKKMLNKSYRGKALVWVNFIWMISSRGSHNLPRKFYV